MDDFSIMHVFDSKADLREPDEDLALRKMLFAGFLNFFGQVASLFFI